MIESNNCFGPVEFGYFPVGPGSDWFTKWFPRDPPQRGYKIHISPCADHAESIARSVLPKLRQLCVPHKVVRSLKLYKELLNTSQRGKFITIYTGNAAEAQRVLNAINPELCDLRHFGGIRPGPSPTTRQSQNQEFEIAIGGSGFVFTYWYEETDRD